MDDFLTFFDFLNFSTFLWTFHFIIRKSYLKRNRQTVTLFLDFFLIRTSKVLEWPASYWWFSLEGWGSRLWTCLSPEAIKSQPMCLFLARYVLGCQLLLWNKALFSANRNQPSPGSPALPSTSAFCIQNQQGASDWWQPFQSLLFGSRFSSDGQAPSQQLLLPFPKL